VQDERDEIRARIDLVDLVGQKVLLKRAGKHWKGLCPFHDDRNPSFYVSPDTGRYKCWSCGEGGDAFTWVMKTQNMEFVEALKTLKSGKLALIPGDPKNSELIRRIVASDDDDRMPPAKSEKKLSELQIATLKQWIQEGAKWQEHWAFSPIHRPELPPGDPLDGKNEVDRFIDARLKAAGVTPSGKADKPTLIRRATLDLTGLPPTVDEIDAFLADSSPEASSVNG